MEGAITETLPGSFSAAALLGAQPIPSIATTSIPAFQESGSPASHVLRAFLKWPGTIYRGYERGRVVRARAPDPR